MGGDVRVGREASRSRIAEAPRAQLPSGAPPGAVGSSAADLLCLLAGDVRQDARGSAQVALIRDLLEPFAAGGPEQALAVVCQRVATLMGASRCSLFLRNEESTHLAPAAHAGLPSTPPEAQHALPIALERLPGWVREMERQGHTTVPARRRRAQRRRRGSRSGTEPPIPPWESYPVLGIPLSACGRAVGVLFCEGTGQQGGFTEDHVRLGNILSAALGPAIGASRARHRDPPEDPTDFRNARLALSGSLDPGEVLRMVSEMALETMGAEVCVALSFQGAGALRVHTASVWQGVEAGVDLIGDGLASRALRTGLPAWVGDDLRAPRVWPREPAERTPLRAGIAVPLWDGAQVAGAIVAYHARPRDYSTDEVRVLSALAAHAGAALRNCVLYERQRDVTETVQRSLAPRLPPAIDGVEVGHLYHPKADQVGGDHYDLIPLGGGRLGLVIGDVAGSGLRAAIHTTMARYMARAFTFESPDPGTVLRKLNEAICTEGHSEVFLTMFYGVLHPSGRLHYANGAHPYPVLRRAGRSAPILLETTGTVVGIIPGQEYEEREVRIHSGDTLLLYTDGITEADRNGDLFGFERLQAAVQEWQGDHPQELVDHIVREVREFSGGPIRDDFALLAIRRR